MPRRFTLSLLFLCALPCSTTAGGERFDTSAAAAAFRREGRPLRPLADGTLVAEAEEFRPVQSPRDVAWAARNWGQNYYAATFANTFLSRKAFLAAPEQCHEVAATLDVQVAEAGRYLALVRYEAAYRFETQFTLKIEQNGREVFRRLYGATKNPKIWAFGQRVTTQAAWSWGAVENVVWEGHDALVSLQPGRARLTLLAGKQPQPAARRHVDVVMLTPDLEGVKQRIEKERYLPLDGMLTQEGDVYLRLHNAGRRPMTLTVPKCTEHSPYWVHLRDWKPKDVSAAPGAASAWTEVGSLLDCFNDGQWNMSARFEGGAPQPYRIEFGVPGADGEIAPIGAFALRTANPSFGYYGDMRYQRRIRTTDQVLYELIDYLKKQPVRGKLPGRMLTFAYTFRKRPDDARYNAAVDEFIGLFNLATTDLQRPGTAARPRGYIDVRGIRGAEQLEAACRDYESRGLADKIAVVSLGDEIGLTPPPATGHEGFRAWLRAQGVKPADVLPGATGWDAVEYAASADAEKQPRLYYYAARYRHAYGIARQKQRTDILRKHLPAAGIGANYSPHHGHHYLGEVHMWIKLFRRGGMTMPWSEDYIWGVPVGSQQMNFLPMDMFRAAIKDQPDARILYYVMPHWPGNTTRSWRRLFYGSLAHGMQTANLFEFRPVQAAYTENYVDLPEMYAEVRKTLQEVGPLEDVILEGRVQPGRAALWFSETSDIWDDNRAPFAAAKRTLYVAIRHQQLPLDVVIEEDALAGDLKNYDVLYLTDRHVSRAAAQKIADWVEAGGRLLATAEAGTLDEFNQPNPVLTGMLGIRSLGLVTPEDANVVFGKQDLPFSKPLDVATLGAGRGKSFTLPVIAAKAPFHASPAADVLGTFGDAAPSVIRQQHGKGCAFYCGFLPGLSYFKPAIPLRPVDRGTHDDSMAHFLPTEFNQGAAHLVAMPAADVRRPVLCSEPLVATRIIRSPRGVVIPLVNWSDQPLQGLTVRVDADVPTGRVSLASGAPVKMTRQDGVLRFTLDLDVADALLLR